MSVSQSGLENLKSEPVPRTSCARHTLPIISFRSRPPDVCSMETRLVENLYAKEVSNYTLQKHLGYFNHIFRLSELHQCDQEMLIGRLS